MKTSTVLAIGAVALGVYLLSRGSSSDSASWGGGGSSGNGSISTPTTTGPTPAMSIAAQAQNASIRSGMTVTESVQARATGASTPQAAAVLLAQKQPGQGLLLSQGYAPYVNQATSTQRPNYVPAAGRAYRTADEIARGVGVGG